MERAPSMDSGLFFERESLGTFVNCLDIANLSPFMGEVRERVFDG